MWTTIFSAINIITCCFGAVLGILLSVLFLHNVKNSRRNKLVNKLPGPKSVFLLGNSLMFMTKREEMFPTGMKMFQRYRQHPLIRLWMGPFPQIIIQDVKIIEGILGSPKLINKAFMYTFLQPWLGLGLLLSSGNKWHTRRKLITPSFHFSILEEFFPVIKEQSEILISILKRFDGQGAFDIYPYLARCALDIICETAMGRRIKAQSNTESEYVKAVNTLAEIINHRFVTPWIQPDFLFYFSSYGKNQRKCLNILHGFTDKVIVEKRKEVIEKKKNGSDFKSSDISKILGKKRRLAFLDMLLESSVDGKGLSDSDIREEVDTFMFEGHDTTASGMNWAIYNIGRLPHIQQKIHEELDRVFVDSDRPIRSEDLKELKYLECVIKESLRLFPPVPFYGRKFEEDVTIGEYTIPAGVDIGFSIYSLHRNPQHFPDPEKFDPDRFLPENSVKRHPYSYLPFSAGPRNCIGQKFAMMEEKLILSQIMRHFKIIAMEKIEDLAVVAELIFRPANGMWIKIESR